MAEEEEPASPSQGLHDRRLASSSRIFWISLSMSSSNSSRMSSSSVSGVTAEGEPFSAVGDGPAGGVVFLTLALAVALDFAVFATLDRF